MQLLPSAIHTLGGGLLRQNLFDATLHLSARNLVRGAEIDVESGFAGDHIGHIGLHGQRAHGHVSATLKLTHAYLTQGHDDIGSRQQGIAPVRPFGRAGVIRLPLKTHLQECRPGNAGYDSGGDAGSFQALALLDVQLQTGVQAASPVHFMLRQGEVTGGQFIKVTPTL